MRYYYGGPGGWSWYPAFGLIMMLVFIALVLLLVYLFFRGPLRRAGLHDQALSGGGNALKILDERLARGEIDIEEYNQRREAIKQHQQE